MSNLPLVGVSACLLGQAVRYDGKDKYTALIAQELNKYCHLIAVCPEVEIGLGVPREKIQLTQIGSTIKALKMPEQTVDVSTELKSFAIQFVKKHALSALVLQDKSPSCGIDNTKLYSQSGEQIGLGSGVFATTIIDLFPQIKVVQASQLQNSEDIERFVQTLTK
ncbi:MAG: DUF523 domain-containing protein [Methylococcales symbiont of Iophon sp. n. MRB-2018]|nr:MAG: DUF523 domain-containing protein [Methylococcales symbiont of Iophon sp. n. MRB-2018]KAF3980403.1 MAG: DUF523 domain-containing protein [Methylococcales symbiont of Iophon sp. n. MRB-2018]